MLISVLISVVSMSIGYMVARLVYESTIMEFVRMSDIMGVVIYELENRVIRNCGMSVDDESFRKKVRDSVSSKARSVMFGECGMDEEWKDD